MHVAIVGAGIAGLYAGLLLRREGHQVTIYERTPRVGGRIFTHHFTSPGASKDAFFEAGAMRIPRSRLHSRVFEMIDYLNETGTKSNRIKLIPYELLGNDQAFFHGRKRSRSDHEWTAEADLPSGFRGKSAEELLQSVVRPWVELLLEDFEAGFAELLQYDELSFREYLRQHAKWPSEVIDYVELFCSQTNQYHLSFTDIIMQCVDFGTKNWTTIEGGMSRLPERAASLIGFQNIILSAEVIDLVDLKSGSVEIRAKSPSGIIGGIYDTVILAIPPQAVQRIPRRPQWSPQKEQAIRSIHFQPLYKMGLHFKTRFWEHFSLKPRLGGQDSTDLRFRWIIYPSNGVGSSGSGVLLVYCWMEDAGRFSMLSKQDRLNVVLCDLARFFADECDFDILEDFIEAADVSWAQTCYGGDAMFLPGQFRRHFEVARGAEGGVYFAGEHLSRHHTWIAGAIDSALFTVRQMLDSQSIAPLEGTIRANYELVSSDKLDSGYGSEALEV